MQSFILSLTTSNCKNFKVTLVPYVLWYVAFCPFLRISKSEFLIQDLISWLIVKENGKFMYQNLSLGVDNQKEVQF